MEHDSSKEIKPAGLMKQQDEMEEAAQDGEDGTRNMMVMVKQDLC